MRPEKEKFTEDGLIVVSNESIEELVNKHKKIRTSNDVADYVQQIEITYKVNKILTERNLKYTKDYQDLGLDLSTTHYLHYASFIIPYNLLGGMKDNFPTITTKAIDAFASDFNTTKELYFEYEESEAYSLSIQRYLNSIYIENKNLVDFCSSMFKLKYNFTYKGHNIHFLGLSQLIFNYESIRHQFKLERSKKR